MAWFWKWSLIALGIGASGLQPSLATGAEGHEKARGLERSQPLTSARAGTCAAHATLFEAPLDRERSLGLPLATAPFPSDNSSSCALGGTGSFGPQPNPASVGGPLEQHAIRPTGASVADPLGASFEPARSASADALDEALQDPEIMAALGLVSWSPEGFGPAGLGGSAGVEESLPMAEWLFLETEHFRWASSCGSDTLKTEDRERLEPLFALLREHDVPVAKRPRKLTPRLRLLVMALRAEELYDRFLELVGHADQDFPATRQAEGPYMGNGRYLGEADKFELIVHASERTHNMFTLDHMGATVTGSLRWHFRDPHKLFASVPASDSDLRKDRWLWPHIAHNLGHMFLAAYKHFSYQPPVWLDEGFALLLEREAEPTSITTEGEEGTLNEDVRASDWRSMLRKIERKEEPRIATLMTYQTLGQLSEQEAASCWSRVRFMVDEHPAAFAELLGGLKGQLDSEGYPTGADLPGLTRKLWKEHFEWTPQDFDTAYFAWLPGFIDAIE